MKHNNYYNIYIKSKLFKNYLKIEHANILYK